MPFLLLYFPAQLSQFPQSELQNCFIPWISIEGYLGLFGGTFCIIFGLQDTGCLSGSSVKPWAYEGGDYVCASLYPTLSPLCVSSNQTSLHGVGTLLCALHQMEVNWTEHPQKQRTREQNKPGVRGPSERGRSEAVWGSTIKWMTCFKERWGVFSSF